MSAGALEPVTTSFSGAALRAPASKTTCTHDRMGRLPSANSGIELCDLFVFHSCGLYHKDYSCTILCMPTSLNVTAIYHLTHT